MARRVNTRFVILLSAIMVLVIAAITCFWFVFVRPDPQKLASEARELMRKGGEDNIVQAVSDYQRALSRRPRDVKLLLATAEALQKMPVKDAVRARGVLGSVLQDLRQASDFSPTDSNTLLNYYSKQLDFGLRLHGGGLISDLQGAADAKLQNDPNNVVAKKYRGIAQVLLLNATTRDADRQQAKADLEAAIKHDGHDYESMFYLAVWHEKEARLLKQNGRGQSSIDAQLKQAKLLAQALLKEVDKSSDPIQRKVWAAELLVDPLVGEVKQAEPVVDSLDNSMLNDPHPAQRVLKVVALLQQVDQQPAKGGQNGATQGQMRAKQLLEAAVKSHPDDAVFHLQLGALLQRLGQVQQAIDEYSKARNEGEHGTAVEVLLADQNETNAAAQQADLLVTEAMTGSKSAKQDLADASKIIDSLSQQLSDDAPIVNRLQGKLDLAENKNTAAAVKLWHASEQAHHSDPMLLSLSAEAFRRTNQLGAAEDQLSKLIQLVPNNVGAYLRLARMYATTGSPDKAESLLNTASQLAPKDENVRLAHADLYMERGQPKKALAIYQSVDLDKHPPVLQAMVRCYESLGESKQAKSLLQTRFEKQPSNLRTLALLLPLVKDQSSRTVLLNKAVAAGADKATVKTLETLAMNSGNTAADVQKRVDAMLDSVKDPALRDLARAQIYLRQGDQKKAKAALAEAAKLKPDLEGVVRMQFNLALQDKDWDKAQQLADKAGSMDLDQASGAFFNGRLNMAKGDYANAVASFQRGLSARPVYSMGQLWLGNALLAQGNANDAADAYQKAVKQQPNNVEAWLATARLDDKQGDHQSALNDLKRASQVSNNLSVTERYLAYEQQYGDASEALKHREQLAAEAPKLYANRRAMAILQAELKHLDAAKATVQKLVADDGLTLDNLKTQLAVDAIAGDHEAGEKAAQAYLAKRGKQADAADYLTLAHYRMATGDNAGAMKAYQQAIAVEDPKTQPAMRELADLLFARGKNAEAETYYQKLAAAHPDDKKLKLRLAETLVRENKLAAASKLIDPLKGNPEAVALRGMIAAQKNNDDQAMKLFTEAINQGAASPAVYYERARVYLKQHHESKALSDLQSAIDKNGSFLQARQLLVAIHIQRGDTDAAIKNLKAMLRQAPQLTSAREQLVSLYSQQNEMVLARATVSDAMQRFPKQAQWPELMGQLLAQNNQLSQALTYWKRAVAIDATPGTLSTLAQGLIASKQAGAAVSLLDGHSDKLNAQPVLQAIKAQALWAEGKKEEAGTLFGHAMARSTALPMYEAVAARMSGAMGRDAALSALDARTNSGEHASWAKLTQARLLMNGESFDKAYALLAGLTGNLDKPLEQARQMLLGTAAYQTGHYKQAQASYEAVLKQNPQDAYTMNNLAFLLADQMIDPAKAVKLAQRAVDLRPNSPQILDTLGWAQFKSGNSNAAQQTLETSVQLQANAQNTYHLAQVYSKLGADSRAKQMVSQSLALATKSKDQSTLHLAEKLNATLTKH